MLALSSSEIDPERTESIVRLRSGISFGSGLPFMHETPGKEIRKQEADDLVEALSAGCHAADAPGRNCRATFPHKEAAAKAKLAVGPDDSLEDGPLPMK